MMIPELNKINRDGKLNQFGHEEAVFLAMRSNNQLSTNLNHDWCILLTDREEKGDQARRREEEKLET
jgi:hypothetical protein